ncbi:uncharacterized protein [Cardiocondyla obscurior]
MADAESRQQQRRRWSAGRSSTPRSHFSPHTSEAFYVSTEPLSGDRGGRALHNASGNGGGPDPDSNSVLDFCAPEAGGRQYRSSGRRPSQNDHRATVARNDREIFYTVPRGGLAVSRKEILRRRCAKDDAEALYLGSERDEIEARPRTLPSIGRKARQETERASSLSKKVSRQDILRRRASIEANSQLKDVTKAFSDLASSGRPTKEDRELPRPSTLPKIIHASKTSRLEEYSTRTRETVGREAPIYGRIRRRKMSLPTGTATSRDSATPSSTLTRFSKTKASGSGDTSTKAVRRLRDPVPDSPDRSKYNDVSRDDVYVKMTRKTSMQASHKERLEPIDKTMSRRRIIGNVNQMDSLDRRMHQDRDQDVVRVKHDAILVSKADIDRLRNFKTERSNLADGRTCRIDSTWSARKTSKTDSWSRNSCVDKDSTWTSERNASCRPKSQTELSTKGQTERGSRTEVRSTTLPSYMKSKRKTSTGNPPARNTDEQRRVSTSGVLTKQSKERSNYVRKTASRVPTHVRTFSDVNRVHSYSPDASSSIFGFCTGKRKIQASVTRRSPSWNMKTV